MRVESVCTQPRQSGRCVRLDQASCQTLQSCFSTRLRRLTGPSLASSRTSQPRSVPRSASASVQTASSARSQSDKKSRTFDVVALGNLCLDIVVSVPELPSSSEDSRRQLLKTLTAAPPPKTAWEVGGNTNFMIAAARLGLKVASIGHVGPDQYGDYVRSILQDEGIRDIRPLIGEEQLDEALKQTLLCFVLVAPNSVHAFCSRYDFGPWPLLPGVTSMPPSAWQAMQDTHAVFLNGFLFDELPADMVLSALLRAKNNGAVVCFDPGPRCWTLSAGARRATMDALLDLSDIVVMTEEESVAVTGQLGATAAAQWVLNRPGSSTQWCIVKQGSSGSVLCSSSPPAVYNQPALSVPVSDTVGCGDSFAAAVVLGFVKGYNIPATMALANAVGAATAMGTGAGTNVASAENVLRLLTSAAQAENGNGGHQPNGGGSGTKLASGNAAALQVLQTELESSNRQRL